MFAIVVAHWPPDLAESLLYGFENGLVEYQGFSESVRDGLFGSVIDGGTEAAGSDQYIRSTPAKCELIVDVMVFVGDRIIAVQGDASLTQLIAYIS